MILEDGGILCDWEDCESLKGEVNHWWLQYEQAGRLVTEPWNDEIARWPGVMHLCGMQCASRSHSEWMRVQVERAQKFGPQLVRVR